jgi:hypothetical protein
MRDENLRHAYRHARHALEDLQALKPDGELAHSLWHHLRHVVYRLGLEMPRNHRVDVPRSNSLTIQ